MWSSRVSNFLRLTDLKTNSENLMKNQTKINLRNIDNWIRAVYMVLFGFLSVISRIVVFVVSFLQFVTVIWSGKINRNLQFFGQGVSIWTCQAFLFLTYNNDEKPFPFSDWPEVELPIGVVDEKNSSASKVDEIDSVPAFVEKDSKKLEI